MSSAIASLPLAVSVLLRGQLRYRFDSPSTEISRELLLEIEQNGDSVWEIGEKFYNSHHRAAFWHDMERLFMRETTLGPDAEKLSDRMFRLGKNYENFLVKSRYGRRKR